MRHRLKPLIAVATVLGLAAAWVYCAPPAAAATSGDAYVNFDSTTRTWLLGTAQVEKAIRLNPATGQYLLTSYRNKVTGREYLQGSAPSDEFSVTVAGTTYTGASTGWIYDTHTTSTLAQGELQLVVTFHNSMVKVNRHYVVYPYTGVIQEWSVIQNVSGAAQTFANPAMFRQRLMANDVANVDFGYMTGGGNFSGSHVFRTLSLAQRPGGAGYTRTFDSHDAPEAVPVDGTSLGEPGNGRQQGTMVYSPIYVLRNSSSGEGVFLTFDYAGHWATDVGNVASSPGNFLLAGRVIMPGKAVANGASITTPMSMTGVFAGDIDAMGNTILDYVYRYKWDYTREEHFGQIRMTQWLGRWWLPNVAQTPNAFAAINTGRYIGVDGMWIDDDWFDLKGNWNTIYGDDFAAINSYAAKNGMRLTVWYPTWHSGGKASDNADGPSTVLTEHPEYQVAADSVNYYGWHLNNANADAVAWQRDLLRRKQAQWGSHVWRYDGQPIWTSGGSDNDKLAQSNAWYGLLRQFKDDHPAAGIFGCSSGGELHTIEAARYSDIQQQTDGWVQHFDGYWSTLLTPPDKVFTESRIANDKGVSILRGPFSIPTNEESTSPMPQATKEVHRKNVELYHYLRTQGVAGRWTKFYRPTTSSNVEPTYFQQKMSQDSRRGYITVYANVSTRAPNPVSAIGSTVTVYPKGLDPALSYTVATREGGMSTTTRTGAQWMSGGIQLTLRKEAEVIFINLEGRPGSGADTTAPAAPASATKKQAHHLLKSGVEVTWGAASDNNWISYYEIFRNGVAIDRVAKGTFYFDIYGTAGDTYEIRAVDGDGNASARRLAAISGADAYASQAGFSHVQGRNAWSYLSKSGSTYTPMTWDPAGSQWKGSQPYSVIGEPGRLHPESTDTVLAWTAPKAGTVRVSGNARKATAGGDGVNVRILKNGNQVWPSAGSQRIHGSDTVGFNHDFATPVNAGDRLYFEVNNGGAGNIDFDETRWMPTVEYGAPVQAGQPVPPTYDLGGDYASKQGEKNWFYRQYNGSAYTDMSWVPENQRWQGNSTFNVMLSPTFMHPDGNDTVRSWQAPKPGTVTIGGRVGKADTGGGDGVQVRILKNGTQIWPASGWQAVAYNNRAGVTHNLTAQVAQGDMINFVVNRGAGANHDFDLTSWRSTVTYGALGDADTVGSWQFNEGSGGSAADSSHSGNTGTLVDGPTRTSAGRTGGGLVFNGVNSHVRVDASGTLENLQEGDYTLAAWVKPATVPPGTGSANDAAYGIVIKPGFHLGLYYGHDQKFSMFHYANGNIAVPATSANTYPANGTTWSHVVGVVSRTQGTVKVYVNGTLAGTTGFTPGTPAQEYGSAPWYFGIASPGAAAYRWAANGAIDEVRMYRKALSDNEIAALYSSY